MSRAGMKKWFKKWHKWPALVLSIFIVLFSLSGIVLNHRALFSGFDVSREYLPAEYRYQNWNLAAVKGSLALGSDSLLLYGNIGIWLTDSLFTEFVSFNKGFPPGTDNRKISSMALTGDGQLWAGTLLGLYCFSPGPASWKEIQLPVEEKRVVKVLACRDSLWVLTRSHLLKASLQGETIAFSRHAVAPALDDDNKVSLFRTLWVIHSGEIYGQAGRLLVDFVALVFIFLTITGLLYFLTPYLIKRMGKQLKSRWKRFNRWSLKWHKLGGSWLVGLLLLTALTGIFLRPPLLIAIAGSKVGKIPYSVLDDPNPWHDKFRDLIYDENLHRFMLATSEGIYYSDDLFRSPLSPYPVQPPVSVMGINVFRPTDSSSCLLGSFSGLFLWNFDQRTITDYLTGQAVNPKDYEGRPVGSLAVTGYIKDRAGQEILFDYGRGALVSPAPGAGTVTFPRMPTVITKASPMSLWNLALEIHTCRIYGALIGDFYILLIPLLGLGILFVVLTGFFSWYFGRRVSSQASADRQKQ